MSSQRAMPSLLFVAKAITCLMLAWAPGGFAAPLTILSSNYPPYSYTDGDAQKGIAIDVLKAAFVRMKVDLKIEFVPFHRAVWLFQRGEADGIFPFAIKPDRMAYTLYPKEHLVSDAQVLFVRADAHITFTGDLGQLGGYSFGKQRDAFNGQVFNDAVSKGTISKVAEVTDQRQVIRMLVASRFDIAVGPRLVMRYYAKEAGNMGDIKELQPALDKPLAAYLGLSKQRDHQALSDRLDQTLAQMHQDGSYQRIIDQYLH